MPFISNFAGSLIIVQIDFLNYTDADFTLYKISLSEDPLKGGSPQSIMYRITPKDQISHF